jgi:hypothetical protein
MFVEYKAAAKPPAGAGAGVLPGDDPVDPSAPGDPSDPSLAGTDPASAAVGTQAAAPIATGAITADVTTAVEEMERAVLGDFDAHNSEITPIEKV